MSWLKSNQRTAWIIGLTLVVPFALYLNALLGLLAARGQYQEEIDKLEPRVARLKGLREYEGPLRESADAVAKQVENLVYPATADRATVAADLQANVRRVLVEAGLSVSNSQVLPVREEDAFDHIGVKLTVSGSLASLDAALAAITGYLPLLLVESLEVWPARAKRRKNEVEQQTINASLQLLSLRAIQ